MTTPTEGQRLLAPLDPMEVQIFGVRTSSDIRRALRFFTERRIKTHFVDLNDRAASPGELKRFAQKFGVTRLVDLSSRRYAELGLGAAQLTDERWLDKLALEPVLLTMPLVRWLNRLTIGLAEREWQRWIEDGRRGYRLTGVGCQGVCTAGRLD